MIINDLDGYYIVFDTKNWNTELDTLLVNLFISNPPLLNYEHPKCPLFLNFILPD